MAQVAYDSQLILFDFAITVDGTRNMNVTYTQVFLGIFFGVMESLYAATICCVMASIVHRRRYFNLAVHVPVINAVIGIIAAIEAIPATVAITTGKAMFFEVMLTIYDTTRIGVIVVILVVLLYTFMNLKSRGESLGAANNPIVVMVRRLSLYPLVQVVSRVPTEIYQLKYQREVMTYLFSENHSAEETALFASSLLTLPCGGLGNMLVFFIVQPEARAYVNEKIGGGLAACGCTSMSTHFVDEKESTRIVSANSPQTARSKKPQVNKVSSPEMDGKLNSYFRESSVSGADSFSSAGTYNIEEDTSEAGDGDHIPQVRLSQKSFAGRGSDHRMEGGIYGGDEDAMDYSAMDEEQLVNAIWQIEDIRRSSTTNSMSSVTRISNSQRKSKQNSIPEGADTSDHVRKVISNPIQEL
jgi:hypothetical protein